MSSPTSTIRYCAKAPLRIGLAGGGTDTSPYAEEFGGAVLNATVNLFAHACIKELEEPVIVLRAEDRNMSEVLPLNEQLAIEGGLTLHRGVYNRIARECGLSPKGLELTTFVDAPPGSGLGTSSTLVVAMVAAFSEWLKLPLGEYEIAQLAWDIERVDLQMAGGKQDQYAATFGGFNFMEFSHDSVLVNPLRVKDHYVSELEFCTVLYNTGTSRFSSQIISSQTANVTAREPVTMEAMHQLKSQASEMKGAILRGDLDTVGSILDHGWHFKKRVATDISNELLDKVYEAARRAGATGGKISGAGGGGFMFFYCPQASRYAVSRALQEFGGECVRFGFVTEGVKSWTQRR